MADYLASVAASTGLAAVIVSPLVQYLVGKKQAYGSAVSGQSIASSNLLQNEVASFVYEILKIRSDSRNEALLALIKIKLKLDPDIPQEVNLLEQLTILMEYLNVENFQPQDISDRVDVHRALIAVVKRRESDILG